MLLTSVFYDIVKAVGQNKKLIVLYGGSSSSKTISILQYLLLYALKYPNKRITISSESLPILKKTIIPDLKQNVMLGVWNDANFNSTDMTYKFPNGSYFQFVPADDSARWHGLRSHVVYFDELFYIKEDIFKQASIRTSELVFASFNPVSKFYITDYWEDKQAAILHSTYKDNPYLSDTIVSALTERISKDENFRRVYLEGKWGNLEGVIFTEGIDWIKWDEFPDKYERRVLGLDFGYNHPAAIVDVRLAEEELYVKEVLYKSKLTNQDIAPYIDYIVVADSADPKGIEELKRLGKTVKAASKPADSVFNGIQLMKQFKIRIHKNSVNLINELRNYKWDEDKNGKTIDKPVKAFDDAIDATRYAVDNLFNRKNIFFV